MKKEFQSIQILHAALGVGSLLFFLVANFLRNFKLIQHFDGADSSLVYIAFVFVPICIAMSLFMSKSLLESFKEGDEQKDKMTNYRTRVILRSAIIEGSILFAAVVILLTAHLYAAVAFVIGWFVLLYFRPTMDEFASDYGLTSQEKHALNNNE